MSVVFIFHGGPIKASGAIPGMPVSVHTKDTVGVESEWVDCN
jgi:hypothetical protein